MCAWIWPSTPAGRLSKVTATLRSPLFAMSDVGLFQMSQAAGATWRSRLATADPKGFSSEDRESLGAAQAFFARWQERWEADGLYRSVVDWDKPKHYALTMLPYPSGDLNMGHWYAMTPSDARARFKRMQGFNVLFPMGFDAFGLPAEQHAIKTGEHPGIVTDQNCDRFLAQLKQLGLSYDWALLYAPAGPSAPPLRLRYRRPASAIQPAGTAWNHRSGHPLRVQPGQTADPDHPARWPGRGGPNPGEFPVFSRGSGNWGGETGSRWTGRSANQSARPENPRAEREPARQSPPFEGRPFEP